MLSLVVLALAAPSGFILELSDPQGLLKGPPTLQIRDAKGREVSVTLNDDGKAPDPFAGDGFWGGSADATLEGPYTLTVQAGDTTWRDTLTSPNPQEPGLQVSLRADGRIVPTEALTRAPSPTGEGAPPPAHLGDAAAPSLDRPPTGAPGGSTATPTGGGSGHLGLVLTWTAALATLAWSLAARLRPAPRALPAAWPPEGQGTAGPAPGRTCVRGDVVPLVRRLATTHRVVLVGRTPAELGAPTGVPPGSVFPVGPGRVAAEDVLTVVRELEGRGAPLVVVLAGALEQEGPEGGHRAAARRIASFVPPATAVLDLEDGPATYRVDDQGNLAPL